VTAGRGRGGSWLQLRSLLLVFWLSGCVHTFDTTTLGVPATMSVAADQPVEGSRFQVTSRAVYAFWGLAKVKDPSLRKALAAQLAGGRRIVNLKIKVRSRWNDVLLTVLTAGLLVPRAVTYEGVVVK
jgi:hypothetical protein